VVIPQNDGLNGVRLLAGAKHLQRMTMGKYAGIDVSLEVSHVCVVDSEGKILKESKVASEPDALVDWLASCGAPMARIGLEVGPLSQWLYARMKTAGLAVELLETRQARDAFKSMPVKTDRKDARGIAQLMRLGWFRPVYCKSLPAQEVRSLLAARKVLQTKRIDVETSILVRLHPVCSRDDDRFR
jgi:transposase